MYKHPSVDLIDLTNNYFNNLLDKLLKEQQSVFLLDDFNINLMNYNGHNPTNKYSAFCCIKLLFTRHFPANQKILTLKNTNRQRIYKFNFP